MHPTDIAYLPETAAHEAAIETINAQAFGPGRFARAAYKIREGGPHDLSLSFVAVLGGKVIASVRMTPIAAGEGRGHLLGPLAVTPEWKSKGVGRKLVAALHGTALFLILLGGFGMLARLGIVQGGLPGWIYAKLALWVALPVIGMLPYRRPASARWVLLGLPVVGLLAGIIALTKPF